MHVADVTTGQQLVKAPRFRAASPNRAGRDPVPPHRPSSMVPHSVSAAGVLRPAFFDARQRTGPLIPGGDRGTPEVRPPESGRLREGAGSYAKHAPGVCGFQAPRTFRLGYRRVAAPSRDWASLTCEPWPASTLRPTPRTDRPCAVLTRWARSPAEAVELPDDEHVVQSAQAAPEPRPIVPDAGREVVVDVDVDRASRSSLCRKRRVCDTSADRAILVQITMRSISSTVTVSAVRS